MRFADLAVQRMLNILDESGGAGVGATHGSLHSAYSTSGANEISGGSPAYARKALTWAAASGRSKALAATLPVFDVPAAASVAWFGVWDAVTAGNFLGMTPNGGTTPQGFVVPDIATDVLRCVAHGFTNGQTVVVWAIPGDPLPTGLAEGTIYYVVSATTDDLNLSASPGGAAINLTGIGAGFLQRIVVEAFGAQGTHTISAGTMGID